MSTQLFSACTLAIAVSLSGCGGGAADSQGAPPCTLSNPASCGGTAQPVTPPALPPVTPPVIAPQPTVSDPSLDAAGVNLVFSAAQLSSAGLPGSEVTVTALVKRADNTALAGAKVAFSTDSGLLSAASVLTDGSGKASVTLGTGGATDDRTITLAAKVGAQSTRAQLPVVGTALTIAGPAQLTVGSAADLTATLRDSAGRPIVGAAVKLASSLGNPVAAGAASTDGNGQLGLHYQASARGSDTLTVTAKGTSAAQTIVVDGSLVTLLPAVTVDATGAQVIPTARIGSCAPLDGSALSQTGQVALTASRGTLYADPACSVALTGTLTLAAGKLPRAYIRSDHIGIATVSASIAGGASGTTTLEFVAPLTSSANVVLQAEQSVLRSGASSRLVAVVRDGTADNNPVKGAAVQFSILQDPSGGNLQAPFLIVTGSDGAARAVFVGGAGDSGKDGAQVQASLVDAPGASATTRMTVNKQALSIEFGTGNKLIELSDTSLQQDYAVFLADSAGNPVPGVRFSVNAWPLAYAKGQYNWVADSASTPQVGQWKVSQDFVCANEDTLRAGTYSRALDLNGNGTLDPGIPLVVTAAGPTDALGMTSLSLRYPRDRANWVMVELTVTALVSGTESQARLSIWLAPLANDLDDKRVSPPGRISPYGIHNCNIPN